MLQSTLLMLMALECLILHLAASLLGIPKMTLVHQCVEPASWCCQESQTAHLRPVRLVKHVCLLMLCPTVPHH